MRSSRALWGIFLIFIGLFLIVQTFDWFSMDLLGALQTLWPVFIIAGGLTLFLKRESHLPRVILWFLVFALISGYAIYLGNQVVAGTETQKTFEMKNHIQTGSFQLNVNSVKLDIKAGTDLAVVSTNIEGIQYDFDERSRAKITYDQKRFLGTNKNQSFDARLNRDIPWTLEVNTGLLKGTIDFSDVVLNQCSINTGSCDLDIVAGSKQKDARFIINGGNVDLNITLPDDVGLEVSSTSAVTRINRESYVLNDGTVYHSDNFDSAPNKLYVELACGVGTITVNR